MELLQVSSQYLLNHLIDYCASFLNDNIGMYSTPMDTPYVTDDNNVCQVFEIAFMISPALRKCCLNYLCTNMATVETTEDYLNLSDELKSEIAIWVEKNNERSSFPCQPILTYQDPSSSSLVSRDWKRSRRQYTIC